MKLSYWLSYSHLCFAKRTFSIVAYQTFTWFLLYYLLLQYIKNSLKKKKIQHSETSPRNVRHINRWGRWFRLGVLEREYVEDEDKWSPICEKASTWVGRCRTPLEALLDTNLQCQTPNALKRLWEWLHHLTQLKPCRFWSDLLLFSFFFLNLKSCNNFWMVIFTYLFLFLTYAFQFLVVRLINWRRKMATSCVGGSLFRLCSPYIQ